MKPTYQTMNDGCETDRSLDDLLEGATVVAEVYDRESYGHHAANAIFRLADGRIVHAECGGCSCQGSGSWSFCATIEEAIRLVPYESGRDQIAADMAARTETP